MHQLCADCMYSRHAHSAALPASELAKESASAAQSMHAQSAALQVMQRRVMMREAALLALLAMLGGALLANRASAFGQTEQSSQWPVGGNLFARLVMVLAVANGACALLLQLQDGWTLWSPPSMSSDR